MGGMSGGMGGMTGGMGGMTGGMGGMTGGMGGMTGGVGGSDSGMEPEPDASTDAQIPTEPAAYGGCTEATVADDCMADATCVESDAPLLGEPSFVCAPACTMVETCPEAEGTGGEATLECVVDRCRLRCSNDFVAPVACPSGMACVAEGSDEFCFDAL
jgi:hypothetical protein